jgi:hypothetical protein
MSASSSSSDSAAPKEEGSNELAVPRRMKRILRFVPIVLLFGVLVGAVYAGFVATHTFTYPSTVAGIVNKSYSINFVANEITPVNTTCGADPCFSVTATSPLIVTASSALSGSGVTLTLIYVRALTAPQCPANQPSSNGLTLIPLPGQGTASITLNASTDYDYCIYYTSLPSINTGILTINYSGP